MRIVRGPENFVGANVIRQHVQATLDGLKGNPAVTLEELTGPRVQSRIVKALVIKMAIHAIQPWGNPATPRLQETDADLGKTLTHPAPDDAQSHEHHFHGMRDNVLGATTGKAINAHRRHAARPTFVEADAEIEFLCLSPEGVIVRVTRHTIIVRVPPQKTTPHA